jgi:phosphoribosylaminoimidazolecarboxamide formyltransferase / IMP cyclohydrolase
MADYKKIKSALISVFHKENLDELVKRLHALDIELYSTGGTQSFIESLGVPVKPVEGLTGYPSILGGRVKTLHPGVFGGILARRENSGDLQQLETYHIPEIDLVVVDLYPFEATLASGASGQDIIEKIDIGGISLIRAAAKNFRDVVIVPSQSEYLPLLDILERRNGETTLEERKWFATCAFAVSSHYDSAIFTWFNGGQEETRRISLNNGKTLRYGENPHQAATFFHYRNTNNDQTLSNARVLQGKELSYNNMLDADAAWKSASDAWYSVKHLPGHQAVSVVKHLNPCGLAVAGTTMDALTLAWAGDPVSAFGGIICFTGTVGTEIAEWFDKKFVEIIIAPEFTSGALEIFGKKKNLRLLETPIRPEATKETNHSFG